MKPLTDLTDAELAEIEARAAAAVPWVAEARDVDGVRGYRIFDPSGDVCIAGNFDYEVGGIIERADAEFIAHAREDVPRLAAALRSAWAAHDQALEVLDEIRQGVWADVHVRHAQGAVRRARCILRGKDKAQDADG